LQHTINQRQWQRHHLTIENVTPTTVIIEAAIEDNTPRAPAALAQNRRGQPARHCWLSAVST
jgi:hypothetical protein